MNAGHVFPYEHLILDACCVINLVASAHAEAIVTSLQTRVAIATYVKEQELLSLESSIQNLDNPKGFAELERLERRGLLAYESPQNEVEQVNYINFAAELGDDGEAVTCAIAVARGWAVATDDRKPINFLRRIAPQVSVITTLEIVKVWSDQDQLANAHLPEALRNIYIYGRYNPPGSHRLYEWWRTYINK